ncbi:MAG TPA: condensation domain-containing protein, partial [Steroidobacter sp.]|uniref:condensation domain-containing protein n=1 Tax=Steroidobacter sp. TaxID=1978227 RepID=UPI002EDAC268
NPQERSEEMGEYVAPRTPTERALAEIWTQLLQVDQVGVQDNFFQLGGHSLHGVKLAARVAERFNVNLSTVAVFQHPTIQKLAEDVDLLRSTAEPDRVRSATNSASTGAIDCAPLSFSQMAYWNYFRLHGPRYEGRSVRLVTTGKRLQGPFDTEAFNRALGEIVRRHDALRTTIESRNGSLVQKVAEPGATDYLFHDLSAIAVDRREQQVLRSIDELVLEPIDLAVGPLFGVRLIRLGDAEHILILAMDHLVSDGTSIYILARDLLRAYMQAARGIPFDFPVIGMQFPEYAVWQRETHARWLDTHGAYWSERLAGCERGRFPQSSRTSLQAAPGWGRVPMLIDREMKSALLAWCRDHHTTPVMALFTAFAALVLRWCKTTEYVFEYQSNGRAGREVENTIGFFASILHLRIRLSESDRFGDLLDRATDVYCQAYEHADFSYLMAQQPRPEFSRNASFNWTPRGSKVDLSEFDGSAPRLQVTSFDFPSPTLSRLDIDCEPGVQLHDTEEEIVGHVFFPLARFQVELMEKFARGFLTFVDAMIGESRRRVQDVSM